jgi:hypothetical protein
MPMRHQPPPPDAHAMTAIHPACRALLGLVLLAAPLTLAASEQVRGGMLVTTRDQDRPEAGTWAGVVTQTFRREVDHLLRLHLADGSRIDCTDEHPFFAIDRGWTGSGSLRPGDRVLAGLASGSANDAVAVQRIERLPGGVVYNLEVATDHTYFVQGQGGTEVPVWVHNTCRLFQFKSLLGVDALSRSLLRRSDNVQLTTADYHEAMNLWIQQSGNRRGIVSVRESINSRNPAASAYEAKARQGTVHESLTKEYGNGKQIVPALLYDNPDGVPFVKFDALKDGNLLVDTKFGVGVGTARADAIERSTKDQLRRWSRVLAQNADLPPWGGSPVRIQVHMPTHEGVKAMKAWIQELSDQGVDLSRVEILHVPK